jgi:hypothetical protein
MVSTRGSSVSRGIIQHNSSSLSILVLAILLDSLRVCVRGLKVSYENHTTLERESNVLSFDFDWAMGMNDVYRLPLLSVESPSAL